MGSPGLNLDSPPPQPPDLTAQAGGGKAPMPPGASVLGGAPPGAGGVNGAMAVNPQGAMLAQKAAVEKVLNQMAQMNPAFAPFAKRALDTIEAGLNASQQQSQGGGPASSNGSSMQPPADAGAGSFPG